jgi:hypothetical protein
VQTVRRIWRYVSNVFLSFSRTRQDQDNEWRNSERDKSSNQLWSREPSEHCGALFIGCRGRQTRVSISLSRRGLLIYIESIRLIESYILMVFSSLDASCSRRCSSAAILDSLNQVMSLIKNETGLIFSFFIIFASNLVQYFPICLHATIFPSSTGSLLAK